LPTIDTATSKSKKIVLTYRYNRLIQTLKITKIALVLILLHRFYFGSLFELPALIALIAIVHISQLKSNTHNIDIVSALFLSSICFILVGFMWTNEGLRDEAMMAFPGILIFTVIMGSKKVFISLLCFITANILLIGYVNTAEIYTHGALPSDFSTSILIVIILLLTSFSVWLIAFDLRKTIQELSSENAKFLSSQQQVEQLLHHDALTSLPNRVLAKDRFEQAMVHAKRSSTNVCLMFIDLDNFKIINDSLGHSSGDDFLIELSQRLTAMYREGDSVCRMGGDEFIVILNSISSKEEVAILAQKTLDNITTPVKLKSSSVSVTCSIGLTLFPQDGDTFEDLCVKSDMAMYRAKKSGKNNFLFFNTQMSSDAQVSLSLIADLRTAVAKNQLSLVYQPKINLKTNQIIGVEALLRWHHPKKGLIPPDVFIPLAESSGLISSIGQWVIEEACMQCKKWIDLGFSHMTIAVNVSPIQFRRSNMVNIVLNALSQSRLLGKHLELELTESLFLDHSADLDHTLFELDKESVSFSIDDFGTGYSNLGYLKNSKIKTLKIDQSFIQKVQENSQDRAIVTAIIQMARSLHMITIAEGVESESTLAVIQDLDCDIGQGYLWSKPLSADELLEFIKKV